MTQEQKAAMISGIKEIKGQIDHYFGDERQKYLLGLRESLHLCCDADPTQQVGNVPEIVEFAKFVDAQLDVCYKDKKEIRE